MPLVQALDILEDYLIEAFGKEAIMRIDHSTPSALRHAAINEFEADPRLDNVAFPCREVNFRRTEST